MCIKCKEVRHILKYEEGAASCNDKSNCYVKYSNLFCHHYPSFTTKTVSSRVYFPLSGCMRHTNKIEQKYVIGENVLINPHWFEIKKLITLWKKEIINWSKFQEPED